MEAGVRGYRNKEQGTGNKEDYSTAKLSETTEVISFSRDDVS